jgi:hypothetical protein
MLRSPDTRDVERGKSAILGEEGHPLDLRLSGQHPVKGIAVRYRERTSPQRVLRGHREFNTAQTLQVAAVARDDRFGSREPAQAVLRGDLPG